jgi:uncharacterized protein YifN (PemK superfamily)
VPFSTVEPEEIEPHHYQIPLGRYDFFDPIKPTWAKADMITCVSFERLDRLLLYERYAAPQLRSDDLLEVQRCVAHAIQLHLDCALAIR